MPLFSLARNYFLWHYSTAYNDIVHIWWNYLWFVNHLFAVPSLLKTLISPFRRMEEDAKVNILLNPSEFFANMFVNMIMRLVGFLIRSVLLSFALLGFTAVLFFGAVFLVLWTFFPFLVVTCFLFGLRLFIAGV